MKSQSHWGKWSLKIVHMSVLVRWEDLRTDGEEAVGCFFPPHFWYLKFFSPTVSDFPKDRRKRTL